MSSEMTVDAEVLRRHATRVGQVASDVAAAQAAAGTTALQGGAFGVLCSFLPLVVSGTDAAAREALSAVRSASDASVNELGAMAHAFDAVDARVDEALRQLAKALGR